MPIAASDISGDPYMKCACGWEETDDSWPQHLDAAGWTVAPVALLDVAEAARRLLRRMDVSVDPEAEADALRAALARLEEAS